MVSESCGAEQRRSGGLSPQPRAWGGRGTTQGASEAGGSAALRESRNSSFPFGLNRLLRFFVFRKATECRFYSRMVIYLKN